MNTTSNFVSIKKSNRNTEESRNNKEFKKGRKLARKNKQLKRLLG
jgi:hypothetical protein